MYRVLYRQYRPVTFSEVAGQNHVTDALSAELTGGRLGHAYLFTGSRGTGKTTCAKILSRAVNCENPAQNGDPCNQCAICKGILDGTILDVAEIDAASNNSVDNIRELKDEADFPPVRAKYRVYIIDEVHMLSIGAFNALLKVLEEPPAHVIFILATTEVHKIPATILSRCQRFDFRRILPEEIAARLTEVARAEEVSITPEAALLIARIADGALRDALSLLDSAIAISTEVTEKTVSDAAGVADKSYLFALTDAIARRDTAAALRLLHTLYSGACDMERLCSELLYHFRHLMLAGALKGSRDLIVCTDGEYEEIVRQSSAFGLADCIRAIRQLEQTLGGMKFDSGKRLLMELAVIKLCMDDDASAPRKSTPPPSAPAVQAPPVQTPQTQSVYDTPPEPPSSPAPEPVLCANPTDSEINPAFWERTIEILNQKNPALILSLKDSRAEIVGNICQITPGNHNFEVVAKIPINAMGLESALEEACGRAVKFSVLPAVVTHSGKKLPEMPPATTPNPELDELEAGLFG
ncbi:MAG: DNA polymerase III subunit gamma/tau [Oscillospiraceae bacterium]|nr:DNA polymerase III subunit gamma/tau [Oscillospiraceae bacterium]